jgi:hypothetical protein
MSMHQNHGTRGIIMGTYSRSSETLMIAELMKELPRIIYHSCDRLAMEKIVEHGLIPGGWPSGPTAPQWTK